MNEKLEYSKTKRVEKMTYEELARIYKPTGKIKCLFIAEAPPEKNEGEGEDELKYFYNDKVAKKDHLLQNIVEILFTAKYKRSDKKQWLLELQSNGGFLIDAIHTPIQSGLSDKVIARLIDDDFPYLLKKLKELADKDTKIILIKKAVYNSLNVRLKTLGFNVVNTEMLHFPSHGHQPQFREKFKELIVKEQINFFLH